MSSRLFSAGLQSAFLLVPALALPLHRARAQAPTLPFAIGERLEYLARAPKGLRGHAQMWIEGPESVRGVPTMVLRFSFTTKIGFVRVSDRSSSWLDPVRFAALRFSKDEVRFMARHSEREEMDPLTQRWTAADGRAGRSASSFPLDELSFIYLIRTLDMAKDSSIVLDRHFDEARNPTVIRSLGRSRVVTPAGSFATREYEMRVRDARNYRGDGVIRFSVSDDPCRRPVRIESTIPDAGTVTMTLASAQPAIAACASSGAAAIAATTH
ncbi:MAG: DUF3108 domain-containing protein [Gemmatimonadales bacterium]